MDFPSKKDVENLLSELSESPASLPPAEGKGMSAEEILELHFGSDYWILKEKELLPNILSAMEHYASQRQSGFTVEDMEAFAEHAEKNYAQINSKWVSKDLGIMVHGSPTYYAQLVEEHGITTNQLYTAFLSSLKKQNEQK